MMMVKEIKLPSGAVLKINPAPFAKARALYQAVLQEVKLVEVQSKTEMAALYKDIACICFSSPLIEQRLWACFEHCQYNGGAGDLKIDEDTFEPLAARNDYLVVCMEVAKENIGPFVKSLYAKYKPQIEMFLNGQQ